MLRSITEGSPAARSFVPQCRGGSRAFRFSTSHMPTHVPSAALQETQPHPAPRGRSMRRVVGYFQHRGAAAPPDFGGEADDHEENAYRSNVGRTWTWDWFYRKCGYNGAIECPVAGRSHNLAAPGHVTSAPNRNSARHPEHLGVVGSRNCLYQLPSRASRPWCCFELYRKRCDELSTLRRRARRNDVRQSTI